MASGCPFLDASKKQERQLGDAINVATRSLHNRLNKLIIARLPLALPPQAPGLLGYATGLVFIAPIYLTFEALWLDLLLGADGKGEAEAGSETPYADVLQTLEELKLPELLRARAVRSDIMSITGWTSPELDKQLLTSASSGHLQHFLSHIRSSVKEKPHVLLAYLWVFYMALFSGGKFIRGSLEAASEQFGNQTQPEYNAEPKSAGAPPVAFFRFDTPTGGDDLKMEFKKRLSERETVLTPLQRDQVIEEAVSIFENMLLLVTQLDEVSAKATALPPTTERDLSTAPIRPPLDGGRLQDSVVLTKERGASSGTTADGETEFFSRSSAACPHGTLTSLTHPMLASCGLGGGRLQDSVALAKERSVHNRTASGEAEKFTLSSAAHSMSSAHAQGTLTPLTDLMAASYGRDARSKLVRFDKKPPGPLLRSGQRRKHASQLDGTVDERGSPFVAFAQLFTRHWVAWLQAMVIMALAVVWIKGCSLTSAVSAA